MADVRRDRLSPGGVVRMTVRSLPMVDFCALWNITGHPAAAVPAGVRKG